MRGWAIGVEEGFAIVGALIAIRLPGRASRMASHSTAGIALAGEESNPASIDGTLVDEADR